MIRPLEWIVYLEILQKSGLVTTGNAGPQELELSADQYSKRATR